MCVCGGGERARETVKRVRDSEKVPESARKREEKEGVRVSVIATACVCGKEKGRAREEWIEGKSEGVKEGRRKTERESERESESE